MVRDGAITVFPFFQREHAKSVKVAAVLFTLQGVHHLGHKVVDVEQFQLHARVVYGDRQVVGDVAAECGVSRATFASWARGDTSPDIDKRITIMVIAYNYDEEHLPFSNMAVGHDEEGEIRVFVKQPKKME